ncbi:DUF3089 domain-containing protein [Christensenellaceae bacterium OttesenSCG-928-K19]|nr:DUF3089 domain-containing protein [Christensenellaceae bacterium OttesenSCG-928-K19]
MDYAKKRSWVFRPDKVKRTKSADVFFVYPTVYIHPDKQKNHNMNTNNPIYRLFGWFMTIWRGRPFAESCNFFAPHYRQVGIESLEMTEEELKPFNEIAYTDVKDAFFYYMEHLNEGRPFILAGHSQGSVALLELIRREFGNGRYDNLFVAAYLPGYSVTKQDIRNWPHMRLVEGEDDLGGIISYNTSAKGLRLMEVVLPDAVCVNPLNWKQTPEYAPKELNLGSVLFDFGKYFRLEKKHFTGAYIDEKQGVVMIDKDAMDELLHVRIGFLNWILIRRGTLHMLDIALFHRNLQKNTAVRIKKYFETYNPKEGR